MVMYWKMRLSKIEEFVRIVFKGKMEKTTITLENQLSDLITEYTDTLTPQEIKEVFEGFVKDLNEGAYSGEF